MNKFKVGDKVKYLGSFYSFDHSSIYIIDSILFNSERILIISFTGVLGHYSATEFCLVNNKGRLIER